MDIMQEIKTWHTSHSRATLERYFALGDMMLLAVTNTGLKKTQVISLVCKDAGKYAMARGAYTKAMMMAAAFSEKQRATLIDAGVPFNQTFNLSTEIFQERKGTIIAKIKDRSMKYPFMPLMVQPANAPKAYSKRTGVCPDNSGNNPDNVLIQLFLKGERNDDGIVDGLSNMIKRIGYEVANSLFHSAAVRTGGRKAVA